jgi:hypothetical protein
MSALMDELVALADMHAQRPPRNPLAGDFTDLYDMVRKLVRHYDHDDAPTASYELLRDAKELLATLKREREWCMANLQAEMVVPS